MPTAAKGGIGIVLENLSGQGLVSLLASTPITSSMSLANQPTGSTGMRLLVYIYGQASGTITFAGKDINGNNVTEGPIAVPATPIGQNALVSKWEYETKQIFGSINASGITTTGLTSGSIIVQGVPAAKFLLPGSMKAKKKYEKYSPNEHRNLLDRDTRVLQLVNKTTLDDITQILYPENSLWVAYMLCGSVPTITTLPASPTALLAATAVGNLSLTTQPTFPGMALQLVVAGSSATGSITLTGLDQFGNAATETITCAAGGSNGNGTYYSTKIYSAINASSVACTGLTSGTVAVNGVFGWKYVFTPGDVIYSATFEKYTGVDSYSLPFAMLEEGTFEYGMDKELKFTGKGIAQDRIVIGDRTAAAFSDSRITALGQPSDLGMVGWSGLCYIDTSVGAVPTTQFGDLLEGKIAIKNPLKPGYTLTNSQNYNRVTRGKREATFDCKLDLTNVLQLEQYRQNLVQYITFAFYGTPIGGGNSKTWQFTFPFRWDDFDIVSTPDMERVEATANGRAEYDSGLGGSYKITIINQTPPTYTS